FKLTGIDCDIKSRPKDMANMASCIQSQSICAETLCGCLLQHGLRNTENVLDAFQLALLCDFPRLSVISHHMIMKHFKELCATGSWIFMQSRPFLEKKKLKRLCHHRRKCK
ncbi:unnamed protein product, partial [Brassica oleracea var. botrytis]